MKHSIFRFTLNMHNHRSQASVPCFIGDTAVRLIIAISDGGNAYHIADGCTAVLYGTKADGTKIANRCIIENNSTIIYDFTKQTTSCAGLVNCEIALYGDDGLLVTAPKFTLVVDEREIGSHDDFVSETESDVWDTIVGSHSSMEEAGAEWSSDGLAITDTDEEVTKITRLNEDGLDVASYGDKASPNKTTYGNDRISTTNEDGENVEYQFPNFGDGDNTLVTKEQLKAVDEKKLDKNGAEWVDNDRIHPDSRLEKMLELPLGTCLRILNSNKAWEGYSAVIDGQSISIVDSEGTIKKTYAFGFSTSAGDYHIITRSDLDETLQKYKILVAHDDTDDDGNLFLRVMFAAESPEKTLTAQEYTSFDLPGSLPFKWSKTYTPKLNPSTYGIVWKGTGPSYFAESTQIRILNAETDAEIVKRSMSNLDEPFTLTEPCKIKVEFLMTEKVSEDYSHSYVVVSIAFAEVARRYIDIPLDAVQKYIYDTAFKFKVATVNDFVDDDGVRKLEITFQDSSIKPIVIEFDAIFTGTDSLLQDKANTKDVEDALALKADTKYVNNNLALKANTKDVDEKLKGKTDLSQFTSTVDELNAGKREIILHEIRKLYATGNSGEQTSVEYANYLYSNTIPKRDAYGLFHVGFNPTETSHATSKKYVDTSVNTVSNRIDILEGILVKKTVDKSVAYEKHVPEASARKAILSSVGGASRVIKSNNLCTNAVEGGIDVSKSINAHFEYTLPAGTYTVFCAVEDGELDRLAVYVNGNSVSEGAITLDEASIVDIEILFWDSTSAIAFPMINEGTTALPYEPYFEPYLESAPTTAIVSEGGVNLIDDVAFFIENGFVKQDNGFWYGNQITNKNVFTNPEGKSGSVTVSYFGFQEVVEGVHLTFYIKYKDGTDDYQGAIATGHLAKLITISTNPAKTVDFIRATHVATGTFYIRDLMINWGVPVDYKPYFKKTYTLPKTVVDDADWGISVDDAVNTYNFDNKEYSKYAKIKVYDGTEDWRLSSATSGRLFYENDTLAPSQSAIICNKFTFDKDLDAQIRNNAFISSTGKLNITADGYNTVEEWKSQLARWKADGTPFTVVYKLNVPEIISITDDTYEDFKFIEVEGGGTVRFENEHKLPVPSTITFAEV